MALAEEEFLKDVAHNKDLLESPAGDIRAVEGLINLKEALIRRLVTVPGALIHRPDYGCGVQNFLNSPDSLTTRENMALTIKAQFEDDFRIEEVVGLRFTVDNADVPDKVTLFVKINARGLGEVELDFQLS